MKKLRRFFLLLISSVILVSSVPVYAATEDFKTFSQLDPRWSGYVYGGGRTIGQAGCYITSFAVLMAYANPDLRDVNTFNPQILAQKCSFTGAALYQGTINNADPTFHWEAFDYPSSSNLNSRIKELLDSGKYVVVRAGPPIASSSTHFSPIVGWDESKNQPKIMDVAGGAHPTWEEWAPYVDRLDICSSDIRPSTEALADTDTIQSNAPKTDEEKQALQELIEEWDLIGMPNASEITNDQEDIDLKDRGDLSLTEQRRVQEIQDGVLANGLSIPDWFNHMIFFIGICLVFYAVLLLMATLFDYSNNFLEVSLVSLITLGKCRMVDKDYFEDNKPTGYDKEKGITSLSFSMLIFRSVFIIVLGIAVMSGIAQEFVVLLIQKIMEVVTNAN